MIDSIIARFSEITINQIDGKLIRVRYYWGKGIVKAVCKGCHTPNFKQIDNICQQINICRQIENIC